MHPERWQSCTEIFNEVVEQSANERAAFLERSCDGDEALRRKVELLLKYHDTSGDFIKSPAFEAAPELLAGDPEALIGQHLGCYRIDAVAGVGGMGVVYLAWDERLGRKVALKLLPQSMVANEAKLGRLKREARTASALNHPNIVTIHEIGEVDSTHYVATEFIEGTTLRERMTKGPILPNHAVEIAAQVASALCVAHRAGIVHRDIKPENIMLRPDGYVKVLDFGIAKLTQQEPLDITTVVAAQLPTEQTMMLGTTRYMSPEQARGQAVDARSDLWSLGVVLYEMLAGCTPFEGETAADVITAILRRDPQPLKQRAPSVSPALQSVVNRSLRKDPAQRYQTAEEMLSELRAIKQKSDGIAARSARWIAPATIAALLVALGLFYAWRGGRTDPARTPAPPEKSIAVLPLVNPSGDTSQEYVAEEMTEALITELAKIGGLRVPSRSSVTRYKDARRPLRQIGRELNVEALLTGSVARSGERVHIAVQLNDATTDREVWAASYERDLRDVLALQREVTRDIVREIGIKLTSQEQAQDGSVPAVNPGAYDHYLRGRFYLNRQNKDDNETAIAALERAVAIDPSFAAAHAELAQAYVWKLFLFAPKEKQSAEKAFVAAEKALSLDPNLAVAYLARGRLLWTPANHFPHEKAIREYHRALTLNPNLDEARNQLALVYCHIGAFDRALRESEKAITTNPNNNLAQFRIGQTLNFQGKYEQALSVLQALPPEVNPALVGHQLVWALYNLGRKKEASAMLDQFVRDYPEDSGGLYASLQAVLAASAGQERMAEDRIESAIEKGKGFGHFHHTAYHIACAYALMNKPEQAIRWLEASAKDGFPCYPLFERDTNLDSLRKDARFVAFLAALRQQWEYYRNVL